MSLQRRIDLVRCAREYDALIIADDVYDWLQWPTDRDSTGLGSLNKAIFPRLADVDKTIDGGAERAGADGFGNAMSNGSFSKICGPGIRVGWCEGSPKFAYGVSQAGTTCSGGAPSQLTSTYMDRLLRTGKLQAHINDKLRPAYGERYRVLVDAVQTELGPLGVSLPQEHREVVGGFFIWVTLPDKVDAEELADRCKEEGGVFIAPGSIFEVPGDESVNFKHSIRLTFSWVDLDELVEGVKRIRTMLESILKGEKPKGTGRSQKGLGQIK